MTLSFPQIIEQINKQQTAPIYGLDGEESFYLNQLTECFENNLLPPAERDFNMTIFYGKDAHWQDIINVCRRFPMFAPKQLVIIKDAAQMKDLNELNAYAEAPSPTTILVIEHRGKKFDGRSKLLKTIKQKGVAYTAEKVKEEQVPHWIVDFGKNIGLEIQPSAAELLATFLGNDLQKIHNEIYKVKLNLEPGTALSPELIQKFIGISKDYNLFELPEVFATGQMDKFTRMMSYFLANPKNAPMPVVIGGFYSYFNLLYTAHFTLNMSEKDAATAMKTWPSKVRSIRHTTKFWPLDKVEKSLMIIAKYSAANVGVKHYAKDQELLKEFIGKLLMLASSN